MKFTNKSRYPEGLKCPKCSDRFIEEHDVNEINGQAVGPYVVRRCEECTYEWVKEDE